MSYVLRREVERVDWYHHGMETWVGVAILGACLAMLAGCNDGADDDDAHYRPSPLVSIEGFGFDTSVVPDGAVFILSASVKHVNRWHYTTDMGVYVGGRGGLEDATQRDARELVMFREWIEYPEQHPNDLYLEATRKVGCKRSGATVSCFQSDDRDLNRDISGVKALTLRACTYSEETPAAATCELREAPIEFP